MQAEVQPFAFAQQLLDLFIGFGTPECFIQIGEYDLGDLQSGSTGHFTADQISDQCLPSLTGTPEFEYVQKAVIGLSYSRQRAAFAKRRYIAGNVNGSDLRRIHRRQISALRGNCVAGKDFIERLTL